MGVALTRASDLLSILENGGGHWSPLRFVVVTLSAISQTAWVIPGAPNQRSCGRFPFKIIMVTPGS